MKDLVVKRENNIKKKERKEIGECVHVFREKIEKN